MSPRGWGQVFPGSGAVSGAPRGTTRSARLWGLLQQWLVPARDLAGTWRRLPGRPEASPAMIVSERQIVRVRWLGILVAAPVAPLLMQGRPLHLLWAVCLAAGLYCLLVSELVIRRHPEWLARGYLMSAGDVLLASAVIALTGGLSSNLYLVYFPVAVLVAVRFGGRATLVSLALVMASYTAAVFAVGAPLTAATLGTLGWRLGWVVCTSIFANYVMDRARAAEARLEAAYDATITALSEALDQRDVETESHSRRVAAYALRLAREAGVPESEHLRLYRGAILHDIGKIGVPDHILRKPGPLDAAEERAMRQHPLIGHRILGGIPFLADTLPVVLHHHERWDGSGYPDGERGPEIARAARIFAIVDAYDAMTSDRPYRRALGHAVAVAALQGGAGTQFDPALVAAFLRIPAREWRDLAEREAAAVAPPAAAPRRAEGLRRSHP